jgi:hypothetical protein
MNLRHAATCARAEVVRARLTRRLLRAPICRSHGSLLNLPTMNLKEQLFDPVAKRLMSRDDSLMEVSRFPRTGIEGWLKVEAVAALGDYVEKLQNEGPDRLLRDGFRVELKAATDCNPTWILEGLKKYPTEPLGCLFMGSGMNISSCMERLQGCSRIVAHEIFRVGMHRWIIGLIVRRDHRPL